MGFFGGGGSPAIQPAPPVPTREDPAIAEAKKKARLAEQKRKGRAAAIIAPREDRLGAAPLERPAAGGAEKALLG
jgi:hypothetical protein